MRPRAVRIFQVSLLATCLLAFPKQSWTHVTLRPSQPLRLGGFADVVMNVPSERGSDTVSVSLEVPDAFLRAGGRLSRIEYPPGWQVVIDKEDKPDEIYSQEMAERANRTPAIKKVTFRQGSIPPDGFKEFLLSFQLPKTPGAYRFPAVQLYADGTEVAWTELVEGAQHPAPSIVLESGQDRSSEQRLPLALSGLAFVIAAGLALDRFRRGKS
jgi:uncharacterized protein YcnI